MGFFPLKAFFPCTLPLHLERTPVYVHRFTENAQIAFKGHPQEQTWTRQSVSQADARHALTGCLWQSCGPPDLLMEMKGLL